MSIEWRPLLLALLISLMTSFALGFTWGGLGFMAFVIVGDQALAAFQSPIASVLGVIVGYIPCVVGAVYLARKITSRLYLHSLLFGLMDIAVSACFVAFVPDPDYRWTDFLYVLPVLPISVLTCVVASKWK